ncbi:MAG: Vgb family protein [Trinickia sp.]|uniref:Vgb family protein n=1 Tax=Trinickia sp. TaxID=2571163 RepID=UPI003F81FB52
MNRAVARFLTACSLLASLCASAQPSQPNGWRVPEAIVAPSHFSGVHGLAIDEHGRLLACTIIGNSIWQVDRATGDAKVFIGSPDGQADDVAIGPQGQMAWTSYLVGVVHYRAGPRAPIQVVASDLPGINAVAFDPKTGKLYVSQVFAGDALWEIDVTGAHPPRLIAKDLGGLDGFQVGADGMIYGPLWFKHSVVRIDPANGALSVINAEFNAPSAVKLDASGNLWVVDAATGELSKVDPVTGRKTVFKTLKPSLDNLVLASDGTIYVSNFADNSITAVDMASGSSRLLTGGVVAVPAGIKVSGGKMWLADIFSYRKVDLASGAVTDVMRMWAAGSTLQYPFALGLSDKLVVLASWITGTVQVLDRASNTTLATTTGWQTPYAALPLADGSVLVAEFATGNITQASGAGFATRKIVATGLAGPAQMTLGRDGALYVTESAAGDLARIDLATGNKRVVASQLALPEGVAQTPWGTFVVAEAGAGRLSEINPITQKRRIVADQLPIGLPGAPGMPPPYVATGVDIGTDGTVYFSANRNNAIYRVRPR